MISGLLTTTEYPAARLLLQEPSSKARALAGVAEEHRGSGTYGPSSMPTGDGARWVIGRTCRPGASTRRAHQRILPTWLPLRIVSPLIGWFCP